MQGNNERDREFKGILTLTLLTGFMILVLNLYYFCYDSLLSRGVTFRILDEFILNLNRQFHLFSGTTPSKSVSLLFLGVYAFGNKAKKAIEATWRQVAGITVLGVVLFFGNAFWLRLGWVATDGRNLLYAATSISGFLLLLRAGSLASRILNVSLLADPFNKKNEQFAQESEKKTNEFSVNLPVEYEYKGRVRKGWVNVVNPFRATMVLGTPGSGKSFSVVNQYIRQHLEKGFTMYVYDYKFPDLSRIAYAYLQKYVGRYPVRPTFYVINFDNPRLSNRCNPLLPSMMTDIIDALEASKTILLNLNKTWIQKQGDFFVESPINFLAAVIWYLKRYDDRRANLMAKSGQPHDGLYYCTFPHAIELASVTYDQLFPILQSEPEIENLLQPFASALRNRAYNQLEGQIASARIPLSRLSSPALYWVMTGNDFSLAINDPAAPKVLCVGNNPDRQEVYGAALGLYNARLIRLVNRKERMKSSLIIDELPTIYFRGLDNLIATARANQVSTCLSLQDLSQLRRDYGDKEATAIFNTTGNIFSGQVLGETAKTLSSRFGKNRQQRVSLSINERDTNVSLSEQMDSMIPESKISNFSQGEFVGAVADNFDQAIEQKIFNGRILVDATIREEIKNAPPIPALRAMESYSDEELDKLLFDNYLKVKEDVLALVESEMDRIRNTPGLQHLLIKEEADEEEE